MINCIYFVAIYFFVFFVLPFVPFDGLAFIEW